MSDLNSKNVVEGMNVAAHGVYIVCDETVADDISNKILKGVAVIEQLESKVEQLKQQWVSVGDDLPSHDTPVLVWDGCDYDIDYTGMECDYGTTFFANTQGVTTHWMPLPKPPTK